MKIHENHVLFMNFMIFAIPGCPEMHGFWDPSLCTRLPYVRVVPNPKSMKTLCTTKGGGGGGLFPIPSSALLPSLRLSTLIPPYSPS